MQNGLDVEEVFISIDLYSQLLKDAMPIMRTYGNSVGAVPNLTTIRTSAGSVTIKAVKKYKNLCFVGTKAEYDDIIYTGLDPVFWADEERARVDKEFEDIVLGDV